MGVCDSLDTFQEKISEMFEKFAMVCAHIDDMLFITKKEFENHLKSLGVFYKDSQNPD